MRSFLDAGSDIGAAILWADFTQIWPIHQFRLCELRKIQFDPPRMRLESNFEASGRNQWRALRKRSCVIIIHATDSLAFQIVDQYCSFVTDIYSRSMFVERPSWLYVARWQTKLAAAATF